MLMRFVRKSKRYRAGYRDGYGSDYFTGQGRCRCYRRGYFAGITARMKAAGDL